MSRTERAIRYGLGAIKGVGQAAVETMLEERDAPTGRFSEPARPVPAARSHRVNRRVLEALIRSGALDALGANRATLMHQLAGAMQAGDQSSRAARRPGRRISSGLRSRAAAVAS